MHGDTGRPYYMARTSLNTLSSAGNICRRRRLGSRFEFFAMVETAGFEPATPCLQSNGHFHHLASKLLQDKALRQPPYSSAELMPNSGERNVLTRGLLVGWPLALSTS